LRRGRGGRHFAGAKGKKAPFGDGNLSRQEREGGRREGKHSIHGRWREALEKDPPFRAVGLRLRASFLTRLGKAPRASRKKKFEWKKREDQTRDKEEKALKTAIRAPGKGPFPWEKKMCSPFNLTIWEGEGKLR